MVFKRRAGLSKTLAAFFEPRMYGVFFRTLARRFTSLFFIDRNPEVRASVFLAGTARSGSTWISEIINADRGYRYMFEPFHAEFCPHFRAFQYLRPDDDEGVLDDARAVLTGRLRARGVDRLNPRFICRQRLVKDIRANLFLKWLKVHFPEVPIVLLLRHPCAVANSRMTRNWPDELEFFLSQPQLVEDHLAPFLGEIEEAKTPFERHVFMWCIQYYVPLRQLRPEDVHLGFYEVFCERPEEAVRDLFAYLGKPVTDRALAQTHKPSLLSRKESAIISGGSLTGKWRKNITDEQVDRAVEILSLFGLDRIYGRDPTPDVDAAREILAGS